MAQKRYKKRQKRSSSKKKQAKRLLTLVGTGLLVVIVIAAFLMSRVFKKVVPVVAEQEVVIEPVAQPLHPRLKPLLDIAQAYAPTDPLVAPPSRALPDTVLLLPSIDVNGDGIPEALVAITSSADIQLDRNLRNAGFTTIVKSLIVSQGDLALLRIDEYAMRDNMNRRIVNQVSAPHGYAFLVSEYEDEDSPFEAPVSLLHLVIIDEFGRPISDEITVYWKPADRAFKATNTHGAPGTY
jgi:hypothetical protein